LTQKKSLSQRHICR